MSFDQVLARTELLLGEGSLYERLRRNPAVVFDPCVAHGALIYDLGARGVLEQVHREYLDIGQRYSIPMVASTATWRANQARVEQAGLGGRNVNRDNARFMRAIRDSYGSDGVPIYIAGQIGPRGDAYRPDEALSAAEAEDFHAPQIEDLARGEVDFLMAQTLPAVSEALGLARALAKTGLHYLVSFVVRAEGTLLDGTPIAEAIARIDGEVGRPPTAYTINCVHPAVFRTALERVADDSPVAHSRIIGLHANTSPRTPEELDGLEEIDTQEPEPFGEEMWRLRGTFGTTILGGCCGTTTAHMEAIARRAAQ